MTPRGSPLLATRSSSDGAGTEGRLSRWSDDYRALGVIWARRTWRRFHGLLVTSRYTEARPHSVGAARVKEDDE